MVQFKSFWCNTDEFTLNMPKWPQTSHDFWDLKALPFCVWWSFRLRNTLSFRSTPLHQTFYFPSPSPHPRTCQAGVEGIILQHAYHIELNLWNQQHKSATNRGRKNNCSWDCYFNACPQYFVCSAKARLLQWHKKHKASCSQPPSVVKTVVKPELESTTRLCWIKLCISLSSSVHEVSHYVSQGHWCWIILVHVVH